MQKQILVVDDDRSIRCSVSYLLRDAGYKVCEAADGEEALESILRKLREEEPFDLLLTDNRMPKKSGLDLICELQEGQVPLPSIFISGSLDDMLVKKLLSIGCSYVIHKPFHFLELLHKVRSVMEIEDHPQDLRAAI